MKEGRVPVKFNNFIKVNEDKDISKLSEGEIALLTDAVLDEKYATISARFGFEEKNANVTTSNIDKMIDVKSSNGTNYIIGCQNDRISKSVGGAWTDIRADLNAVPYQWTSFSDLLIFTNNSEQPFYVTGDALTVTNWVELERPDVTGVTIQRAKTTVGAMKTNSYYRWVMVYVTEKGDMSQPSNPITFNDSATVLTNPTTTLLLRQFIFQQLPTPTDTRITAVWLYRTEGYPDTKLGDRVGAQIYYLTGKITFGETDETQYVDGLDDESLDFSNSIMFLRHPTKAQYTVTTGDRLFYGNVTVVQRFYNDCTQYAQLKGSDTTYPAGGQVYEDGGGTISAVETANTQGAGLEQNKWYMWSVTYVNANGFESTPAYSDVYQSTGADFAHVDVRLLDSPRVGANKWSDKNAVTRRIYRTAGEVSSFAWGESAMYLHTEENIDRGITPTYPQLSATFSDVLSDGSITGNATYSANETANTKTWKSAFMFSQVGRPTLMLLENIRQAKEEDNDPITGMIDDGSGLLIFKTNRILKVYMTGDPTHWYIREVWGRQGCDEPLSLIKKGNTIYFRYQNKPYKYISGGAPEYIGYGKQTTLDTMAVISTDVKDDWVIYACTASTSHYILIYDLKLQTWYEFLTGVNDLTSILVKKYTDFWTRGELYIAVAKKTYGYGAGDYTDDFGTPAEVTPAVTLPRIQIDGHTRCKLREVWARLARIGTTAITLDLTSDGSDYSPVAIPAGSGLLRIIGFGDKIKSSYFEITLTGGLKELSYFGVELRPKGLR